MNENRIIIRWKKYSFMESFLIMVWLYLIRKIFFVLIYNLYKIFSYCLLVFLNKWIIKILTVHYQNFLVDYHYQFRIHFVNPILIEHHVVYHVHHVVFRQVLIRFLLLDFYQKNLVFPMKQKKFSNPKKKFFFQYWFCCYWYNWFRFFR